MRLLDQDHQDPSWHSVREQAQRAYQRLTGSPYHSTTQNGPNTGPSAGPNPGQSAGPRQPPTKAPKVSGRPHPAATPPWQGRQTHRLRAMPGNTFGSMFRVTTFGESHGPGVGCVIDGRPAGLPLNRAALQAQLTRRRPGQNKLVTPRNEADEVEILSGLDLDSDRTLGTPIAMLVRNADQRSRSYEDWHHIYRPSHADFGYDAKYGVRAWQGGGVHRPVKPLGALPLGP